MIDAQDFLITPHPCESCPGHCCECFVLSIPYDDLISGWHAWRDQVPGYTVPTDVYTVAPMVRLLGRTDVHMFSGEKLDQPREFFKCVHHNKTTGRCNIYDMRPWVCRVFDPQQCEYLEAMDGAKE